MEELQLYNTLSGKKEKFVPRHPGEVSFYGCGPTVYGLIHVGNARAFICQDLYARIFKLAGYKVRFARNITDIDDKIIKAAQNTQKSAQEVATHFSSEFMEDMRKLKILPPDIVPKATEHMEEITKMISGLIQKDLGYSAETPYGNDVYYNVGNFKDYGKLSKRKTDELLVGARVEPGEAKKSPVDFALWKAAKPGEPHWHSPWGEGRPGWHIECSAMIHKHFPDGLDVHAGGLDLIFPHHENEIAQSEGFEAEKTLATYWLHNAMITFGKEKMSKSLGNIVTLRDFLAQYGAETLRLLVLQQHYRSPIDFSPEPILRSEALLERLYTCKQHALQALSANELSEEQMPSELKDFSKQIEAALFDDMNSAKALGHILKAARVCFRENKMEYWRVWGSALPYFNNVFGILEDSPKNALELQRKLRLKRMGVTEDFAKEIDKMLLDREQFRAQKNFTESDRLRKELEARGVSVMDGPDGASWSLLSAL